MGTHAQPATSLINPESRAFRAGVIALVCLLFAAAFALSAAALTGVAAWANVHPNLTWLMAVVVDAGVLICTAMALHERQRGFDGRVRALWASVAALTLVSAVMNGAHALDADVTGWRAITGAGYATIPPLLVWWATHLLAWLITATPAEVEAQRADQEAAVVAERAADTRDAVARMRQEAELDAEADLIRLEVAAESAARRAAAEMALAEHAPAAVLVSTSDGPPAPVEGSGLVTAPRPALAADVAGSDGRTDWKARALHLASTTAMSNTEIAAEVGKDRSQVSRFLTQARREGRLTDPATEAAA